MNEITLYVTTLQIKQQSSGMWLACNSMGELGAQLGPFPGQHNPALLLYKYLFLMNDLQATVLINYGKRLVRSKTQGNPHFLFTAYLDLHSQETYYLRTLELPTFLYISEASTQLIADKYGPLMPKFKIIPIDRQFQVYSYLVRSPLNIMPLSAFLQLKRDCGEVLDIEFFLRFVEFAKSSFKVVQNKKLPQFSPSQIGLTESGEFVLCDPAFYFSGHESPLNYEQFGAWIASFLREVLNLPLSKEEEQQILKERFGQYLEGIRSLFNYLMGGEAILEVTEAKIANAISRFSEDISTITNSSVDMNELQERAQKESTHMRSTKFKKMGTLGKIIILFVVLGIMSGVGVFTFKFFTRSVQCNEGEFIDSSNQCLSCASGCLRCDNGSEDTCSRCAQGMYLVLQNEEDNRGYCFGSCQNGRVIRAFVCVKDPAPAPQNQMADPAPQNQMADPASQNQMAGSAPQVKVMNLFERKLTTE